MCSSCPLFSARRGDVASCGEDLVPWPSGSSAPVALEDALLEADRSWLQPLARPRICSAWHRS
eukprot:2064824-Pyramimonas_sp.AAC.1